MATLPHDTYAAPNIPLWATAGAGQEFVSPSVVVNDVVPATAQVSIIVNTDNTGSLQLNTIPAGTPLNEVKLEGASAGISLYTNGEPTLTSAPNITGILGDLEIVSRQTGGTWNFNNNQLSYNAVKQLTGDATFTQLGENTYSDAVGLNVWNVTSSNSTTTIGDTDIEFYTSSGGSSLNLTYGFTSQLVPNITSTDPTIKTANARTPIFPNDALFDPNNAQSDLVITGGSGTPYSIQVTNDGLTTTSGIGCSIYKTNGDNLYSTDFPFWIELTMFDPASIQYGLFNNGDVLNTNLVTQIKNVAGVLSFIPLGTLVPVTYLVGDKVRVLYEWGNDLKTIMIVTITKNNVTLTRNIITTFYITQIEPVFYNTTAIAPNVSYTFTFNYGNTSPLIAGFNSWEWTTGLGGLYGFGNTGLSPSASGSSPNSTTYWSTAYLQHNCTLTSPPITLDAGLSVTISAYKGSKLGRGTLTIYQNGSTLLYSSVITSAWTQTNIGTFTSTGSDTLTFVWTDISPLTDVLSLQRINLNYNNAVDTLIGGIGKSGSAINMGAGAFLSSPTIQMTSSNVVLTKPINMSNFNISNVGTISANTITYVGGGGEVRVNANLDMFNNSIGNMYEINVSNSRANNIRAPYGLSNINVLNNLNLSNNNISNISSVETANTRSTTAVFTPYLNSLSLSNDLNIGSSSTQYVNIYNAGLVTGSAGGIPMNIQFCDRINGGPACATGSIWYTANFGGFRNLSLPLPPALNQTSGTRIQQFNSVDDYISTSGYVLPPYSVFTIYYLGTQIYSQTNGTPNPREYTDSSFALENADYTYTLIPYLTTI